MNMDFHTVQETDMYEQIRNWNISKYSDNDRIRPDLQHLDRLHIVGKRKKGEFFLKISNLSSDDADIANLSITLEPPRPIYEYRSLRLCCQSNRFLPEETVRWFNGEYGRKYRQNSSVACLYFENIDRNDTGTYICKAEHSGQTTTKTVTLHVLYPPLVNLENETFLYTTSHRTLRCIADGDPENYTYGNWEHRSFLNDHIRYLNRTSTGDLILPVQEKQQRYQDSGIYVCSVSNGVPGIDGKHFQKGQSYVFQKGPPVFVNENKGIQYGKIGIQMELKVNVYSLTSITCQYIATSDGKILPLKTEMNFTTTKDKFYGQEIKLHGSKILFRFPELTKNQLTTYTVTVCNVYGNSSFVTKLQFKENDNPMISMVERTVVENRDTALVSAEQSSTSSDNDNSISEHLDDGYEYPYTTLVVINRTEDEHVYLRTRI
ncbi:TTN [Mytilus coruscus]|uniref:TTN n=1 Tax=Mytilus coruscus TaxID=42192 RepID=A0A6J8AI25_MYTCO|nr:TTN [Mytilus coruscus]